MKKPLSIIVFFVLPLFFTGRSNLEAQTNNANSIIIKENGKIIKGYMAFEDFLNSDHTWESYKKLVLNAYPQMQAAHDKQLTWGSIDAARFPEEVKYYTKMEWEDYFSRYDDKTLNVLYDSVISKSNRILRPVNDKPVDLFLFLPYGGCFILWDNDRSTIYLSLLIDPADAEKIITHEYAHNLHIQRHPVEPFSLSGQLVAEGIAVYLTTLVMKDAGIYNSIPFMPESSVKWCLVHEQAIKDSIYVNLDDSTFLCLKKFVADGNAASPPTGFVEKTGYFAGYRIIEACIKKGMTLEEICSSDSDDIVAESGYFK
jgi:uncharacterized protein YjaZ